MGEQEVIHTAMHSVYIYQTNNYITHVVTYHQLHPYPVEPDVIAAAEILIKNYRHR